MSVRAALVVGNAVKNKIQHQTKSGTDDVLPEEEQLNELLQSQIATDESEADINATGLEEDPTLASEPNQLQTE